MGARQIAALLLLSYVSIVYSKRIIVCDAGSTGTRVYVYTIDESGALSATILSKVKPGLSTFGDHPRDAPEYLLPLFSEARDVLQGEDHSSVEVFIMATAGMRLLSEEAQEAVWDAVYKGLTRAHKDKFPFRTKRENFATITGETEGFFAALATNQLAGLIDSQGRPTSCKETETPELLGALDLGGSSTQIIFPVADAGCAKLLQQLRGSTAPEPVPGPLRRTDFWTNSYLGYGAEKATEKIVAYIAGHEDDDPCLNPGATRTVGEKVLSGSGNAPECRWIISSTLFGPQAAACDATPGGDSCALQGVHVPERAREVKYLAMSVYFYAMDCVRTLVEAFRTATAADSEHTQEPAVPAMSWPTPSISEMKEVVNYFCKIDWIKASADWIKEDGSTVHQFTDANSLSDTCLRSNYVIVLLEEVYGIPQESNKVTIVQEFHGEEVEWTRGAAISVLAGTHAEAILVVSDSAFYGVPGKNLLALGIVVLLLVWVGLEYNKRRKKCRKSGIPVLAPASQKNSV